MDVAKNPPIGRVFGSSEGASTCLVTLELAILFLQTYRLLMKKFNLYLAVVSVVVDLSAILFALVVAYQLRAQGEELFFWPFNTYLLFVSAFLPVWLILLSSQGLYNIRSLPTGWNAFGRIAIGLMSGWGVMLITLYLSRSPAALVFPRSIIAYGMILTLLFTFFGRFLLSMLRSLLRRRGHGIANTIIVSNRPVDHFIKELSKSVHAHKVIAVLNKDYVNELEKIRSSQKVDEVIVAAEDMDERALLSILEWAESNGINIGQIPSLLSVKATNIETSTLAGTPIMYFKRTPLEGWGRVFKRILDIVLVIPTLVVLSPLYLLLALLVAISSRGPIFYRETRIGQDGHKFFVRKYRSMYPDWRERFPEIQDWSNNEKTDPRVTPIGRILRKTDLDELPQLWDILIGSMSIVGPRPEQPKYVEKFSQEIPHYLKRHHVKSGLTGWAQINGLRGDTSISERVKYDLYYIENWSIWFDLRIIFATFIHVIRRALRGA